MLAGMCAYWKILSDVQNEVGIAGMRCTGGCQKTDCIAPRHPERSVRVSIAKQRIFLLPRFGGQISKSQATEPLRTSCMRFLTGMCTGWVW